MDPSSPLGRDGSCLSLPLTLLPGRRDARGGGRTAPRGHPLRPWWPAMPPGPGGPTWEPPPRAAAVTVTQAAQPRAGPRDRILGGRAPPRARAPGLRPETLEDHPPGAERLPRSWHRATYLLGDRHHKGWSWRAPPVPRAAAAAGHHLRVPGAERGRRAGGHLPAPRTPCSGGSPRPTEPEAASGGWERRELRLPPGPLRPRRAGSAGTPTAGILGQGWAPRKLGQRFPGPHRPHWLLPSAGLASTSLLAPRETRKPESWGPEAGGPSRGPPTSAPITGDGWGVTASPRGPRETCG